MKIYDCTGKQQTLQWLYKNFGDVTIEYPPANQHNYELTELRAAAGHAAVIVKVLDATGEPLRNIKTAWHWPDAPVDTHAGWFHQCVIGITNANGDVGHAMGKGAWYTPPAPGPHATWIYGPGISPIVKGLGMVHGSGRLHLDVTFTLRQPDTPGQPDNWQTLRQRVLQCMSKLDDASAHHATANMNIVQAQAEAAAALDVIDYFLANRTED